MENTRKYTLSKIILSLVAIGIAAFDVIIYVKNGLFECPTGFRSFMFTYGNYICFYIFLLIISFRIQRKNLLRIISTCLFVPFYCGLFLSAEATIYGGHNWIYLAINILAMGIIVWLSIVVGKHKDKQINR